MRTVRLALGEHLTVSRTTMRVPDHRAAMTLRLPGQVEGVDATGVEAMTLSGSVLRLEGVAPGASVEVTSHVAYGASIHGLARLVDARDGLEYVVASGALGGAAQFFACEPSPYLRTPTTVEVSGHRGTALATGRPVGSHGPLKRFSSEVPLAAHHVAVAAGPWRLAADGGVRVLARRSLEPGDELAGLVRDARRAHEWVSSWFEGSPAAGRAPFTQVLVPDPPWLGMEHPGCALVSERLLAAGDDLERARRVAVLAHEVAHQWLGNLVSPRRGEDVGVFEGFAELVGQLACAEILGSGAQRFLDQRRRAPALVAPRVPVDDACAGLAEVAGPVQHAELFRVAREELGPVEFRARVRGLCSTHRGGTATVEMVWAALGLAPRHPRKQVLPVLCDPSPRSTQLWDGLEGVDPATAVWRAREAFRATSAGPARVRAALLSAQDPDTPPAVAVGLSAELSPFLSARNGGFAEGESKPEGPKV